MLKNFKRRVNRQNNNPPITGEGIQNLLNILTLFFIKLPTINKIIDNAKQEQEMLSIVSNSETVANEQVELKKIVSNIIMIYDEYTNSMIEDAFNKVIKLKSSEGKTEKEITRLVIEHLQKKKNKRSKKSIDNKPSVDYMKDFLEID